ncbi:RNA dependent RNA polymerase [Paenibacillus illinoisensis]|uniref:Hydrolase n=1 Tax=Paenibacillus illinoisensis TaxID=59845 RepID=A0A2W0C752_9BACL|nr:RNA dependent RNA polymerase [Paenibacillus illinoisensis]PYY28340.1 Hydrolase [Paenibacillus illinoisensis]
MALDKQVYIYSVDTSAFFTQHERLLRKEINRAKQNNDNEKVKELDKSFRNVIDSNIHLKRSLNPNSLSINNKVSLFESALTRTLGLEENNTYEDVIIVETHYYSIFDNLIENGFTLNNEEYVPFTASAGQIRTKKTVFMKKETWDKVKLTLMCGLTEERINGHYDINKNNNKRLYGVSINKYLAYLALCSSATDLWKGFNINRSIVVDDFETSINTTVDFVDDVTYTVSRRKMDVPINHTDGCGMILPRKSKKAFMVRLPWVKGLLVPFPFDKFVNEENKIITDIYGKQHDIVKEKIEVIFTKSQFKMWKYYQDWDEYKALYKAHNCHASITNTEEDELSSARLCYQMLQTLTLMSEDELDQLVSITRNEIQDTVSNPEEMLNLMGATKGKFEDKNNLQQALYIYPELLLDPHVKNKLKEAKASLLRKVYTGKIKVNGCYTFIAPDLYAFCEHLFEGIQNPVGLLQNGEVSCVATPDGDKVDCLRSPHLYKEHAVRTNVSNELTKTWFVSKSVHTSIHDPISKILMFDCDGDKVTVSNDSTLVKVAERNMIDVVPLYYDMKKAPAEKINRNSIKQNLKRAFSGNIGIISNDITKLWNSDIVDIDLVKIRTMENNFEIDAAKTNYKPIRPEHIKKLFKPFNKMKMPHFFSYEKYRMKPQDRKNKKAKRTTEAWSNTTTVNRLKNMFPDVRIRFKAVSDAYQFDYRKLMKEDRVKDQHYFDVLDKYKELNEAKWMLSSKTKSSDINNADHLPVYTYIRNELLKIHNDPHFITDVLIEHLYNETNTGYKTTLWSSFGDIIVENLKQNLKSRIKICERCDTVIENNRNRSNNSKKYCEGCAKLVDNEKKKERNHAYRSKNIKKSKTKIG